MDVPKDGFTFIDVLSEILRREAARSMKSDVLILSSDDSSEKQAERQIRHYATTMIKILKKGD